MKSKEHLKEALAFVFLLTKQSNSPKYILALRNQTTHVYIKADVNKNTAKRCNIQ